MSEIDLASSSARIPPLSSHGEWHRAPAKKYQESVLIVPFFGAKKHNLKRHVEFLNDLGFDVVIFDLKDEISNLKENLISAEFQFGLKHIWSDQIEMLLNQMPGQKIIFSFSNPSASAIEAIARRNASDVRGLICDSGPSGELYKSMINFFTYEQDLKIYPLRVAAAALYAFLWHPRFSEVIHEDLNKFPEHFPVLSIRGWKDRLISVRMIDRLFEMHTQLDWQKLSLPLADHLNGLKDFPDDYIPPVTAFLKSLATKII